MKRVFLGVVLLVLIVGPIACSARRARQLESQVSQLTARVTKLEDQLDDVRDSLDDTQAEFDALSDSVEELASAVTDFDSRDWDSVVPDVVAATDEVESATGSVETALDDAISAAEGETGDEAPASNVRWHGRGNGSAARVPRIARVLHLRTAGRPRPEARIGRPRRGHARD